MGRTQGELGVSEKNPASAARDGRSEVVVVDAAGRAGSEPRTPCAALMLVVSGESESNFYAGFTENLSESGVFVATRTPLKLGSRVDLSITLPHNEPIRARGTVRWLRLSSGSKETPVGMGVRFDQLAARDADRVQEFAKTRAPLFFDDEAPDPVQNTTLRA
jgi:uncharacterized protein (TIGR02266 family)